MSSGGSSGFPSTPAPTPFSQHPGGVRPEDLAAGISRYLDAFWRSLFVKPLEKAPRQKKSAHISTDSNQFYRHFFLNRLSVIKETDGAENSQ